jgi:two-component system OmpR family response regulator
LRILIVEDDEILGQSMTQSLSLAGFETVLACNYAKALQALVESQTNPFNTIVLDLGLPDGNGYQIVHYLRQQGLSLPVLIVTARDAVEDRVQGLDLGADDYVVKPVALAELHARVRALIRRHSGMNAPMLNIGNMQIDILGKLVRINGQAIELSGREWSVLEYLASHSKRIVTKEQLIQAVTGWDQDISANAIEAYVHRIRSKIEGSGVTIQTVRGLGYMLEATSDV